MTPTSVVTQLPGPTATGREAGATHRAGGDPAALRRRRRDRWVAGAIATVALAVFVRTLMPGIGFSGDAAKWQMLSRVGGVPHATGYPLYVALIQAFESVVPVRTAAWRTNLFSAVCGAAAVAVLYLLLRRLGVRGAVAAATALTFAFTTAFWTQAVIAEVYTLHILFLASILTCLAQWRLGGSDRWLLGALALVALSFGNHLTTVLVLPGLLWILWSDRWRIRLVHVLWAAGAAVLAAGQYLYLMYLADVGGYVESRTDELDDLVRLVTGGPFKSQMLVFGPVELVRDRVPMLLDFLRDDFRILLIPAAYGLWRGLLGPSLRHWGRDQGHGTDTDEPEARPRRDVLVAVALLGLGSAAYGLNFDVPDVIVFFLPLFMAVAVFVGLGLDGVAAWVEGRFPGSRRAAVATAAVLAAIPLLTAAVDYRDASQRGNVADQERIEQVLAGAGEHAVFLTDNYNHSEYLWYYLLGEGLGAERDLRLVHEATPAMVADYFAANTGPVAAAAGGVAGAGGRTLLTMSPEQAEAMADAGFSVTRQAPGVWRIDPPPA